MAKNEFTKSWIIENAIEICSNYEHGELTLRALHYQLVSIGMINDTNHYKRVVSAMKDARWDGLIAFEQFSDLDREMIGETAYKKTIVEDEIRVGKRQIRAWMDNFYKNRWENQPNYVEVLIEKKALQGVFAPTCENHSVGLGACKGYPSLTFLHEMAARFKNVKDKDIIILYFGDYDPSGEDIPRSIVENLERFGVYVHLERIALMEEQVLDWNLPPAPAKPTDSRTAKWDGLGQVELDAVRPERIKELCEHAILEYFDSSLYDELIEQEEQEAEEYRTELKRFVNEDL